jgi:alkylresorcinol/alkylpyrone synthase
MGWDFRDTGFQVVLSAQVPQITRENIAGDVDAFLASQGLARGDVRHWIAHTGGPKVLEAFQEALALPDGALARSWRSLEEVGNLSSASVLFVLADLLASGEPRPGDRGLVVAMGPGFCAEMVLLQW